MGKKKNHKKPRTIKCNVCKESFLPVIKTNQMEDLEITHFVCPSCKTDYIFFVANQRVKELVVNLRNIAARSDDMLPLTQEEQDKVENLKAEIMSISRRLREELKSRIKTTKDFQYDEVQNQ